MSRPRQLVLRGARRVGAEPALRAAQRALEPPSQRRNRRDDDHLRLLMAFSLRDGDACVDVGANKGDLLAEMVRLSPSGRHHAFEPLPEMAEAVRRRFGAGVVVHDVALGKEPGEADFHRNLGASTQSGLLPLNADPAGLERMRVRVERLDDLLPPEVAPRLIKIDVEGAERGVVEGSMETIRRHRPIVALEHGAAAAYFGTTPRDMHELLVGEAGLRWFDLDGGGPYSVEALERTVPERWNWVLLP